MKTIFTPLITFMMIFSSYAQPFSGLVLEEIDNGGAVTGTTYRLYAQINEGLVYAMFGDELNPHLIETTTTFFNQDLFGGQSNFQHEMNIGAWGFIPALEWDTWVTLGDSYDDATQTVGDLNINDFSSNIWSFGGTVNSDASIFRTPDDPNCLPDANGFVLLAQFTTDGTLSGYINLRGHLKDYFLDLKYQRL